MCKLFLLDFNIPLSFTVISYQSENNVITRLNNKCKGFELEIQHLQYNCSSQQCSIIYTI